MTDQFSDVVKNIISGMLSEMYTVLPGIIEKYEPSLKQVSVKPLLKRELGGAELELPVIENVPVIFPSTNKALIAFPLYQGDGCLLLFSQRSLDDWLSKGGDILPSDPRMFNISDAIAIPGLFNFKKSGRASTGKALEIYHDDGNVEIQGKDDFAVAFTDLNTAVNTYATSGDTERTNIITLVNLELGKIATAINAIVPGSYVPAPITTTPVSVDISGAKVENVLLP